MAMAVAVAALAFLANRRCWRRRNGQANCLCYGSDMLVRHANTGPHGGNEFSGCSMPLKAKCGGMRHQRQVFLDERLAWSEQPRLATANWLLSSADEAFCLGFSAGGGFGRV